MLNNNLLLCVSSGGGGNLAGLIDELRARAKTGALDPGISGGTIKCTGMMVTVSATIKLKDLSAYRAVITEIQPLIWYELHNFRSTMRPKNSYKAGSAEFEQAIKGGNMSVGGQVLGCNGDNSDNPKILCGGVYIGFYDKSILYIPNLW